MARNINSVIPKINPLTRHMHFVMINEYSDIINGDDDTINGLCDAINDPGNAINGDGDTINRLSDVINRTQLLRQQCATVLLTCVTSPAALCDGITYMCNQPCRAVRQYYLHM